jgi:hypothetical protein
MSNLCCIITGIRHSGTTILSKTISSHSEINGPWECNLLLNINSKLSKFSLYSRYCYNHIEGLGKLNKKKLKEINKKKYTYGELYNYMYNNLLTIMNEQNYRYNLYKDIKYLFDKSPHYINNWYSIYKKILSDKLITCPIFVIYKDFDNLLLSFKKRNYTYKVFCLFIKKFIEEFKKLNIEIEKNNLNIKNPKNNIYFINYENYLLNEDNYNTINNKIFNILKSHFNNLSETNKLSLVEYINKLKQYNIPKNDNIHYIQKIYDNSKENIIEYITIDDKKQYRINEYLEKHNISIPEYENLKYEYECIINECKNYNFYKFI